MSTIRLAGWLLVFSSILIRGTFLFSETYTYQLKIQPNTNAKWDANLEDVRRVLLSAGKELYQHFPDRNLKPILVEPKGGPIVLYKRGKEGEFRVKLSTGGTYWSQYSFQFAHEMCHILSRYDEQPHANRWFEETMCEVASLYVLRRMSETWKTNPPYPNFKSYAPHLKSYAQDRIDRGMKNRPVSLSLWYAMNEAKFAKDATLREKNLVMAVYILDLIEKQPANWEAVAYLNVGPHAKTDSFQDYLHKWFINAPRKYGAFIQEIGKLYDIEVK